MKILLVAPCPKSESRHNNLAIPQLTLSLIAGMTPPEHEVEICEEVYGEEINYDNDYDLIGITLLTQTCIRGYEIANEFKKRDKTVVFGGMHATALPKEAIIYGDAVVIGEVEGGLWEEILEDVKKDKLKQFYRPDKPPDLQDYVPARRDLIKCTSGKFTIAPIETTRGCAYNCDFCSVSRFFGTRQRHKPLQNIITEAESCQAKFLFFTDDNITGDKKYARQLFQELIPLNKIWVGQASINITKDEELMKLAYKSGCRTLFIGFESMTNDSMHKYRKSLKSLDENVLAVKKLRNNGIMTFASLIFGLDTDTEEVFDLCYEFLSKSKTAFFQACPLTPYPGTPVFNQMKEEGRILTDDWSKFDSLKVVISPKNISPEKLLQGYHNVKNSFYSYKSILQRALPNISLGIVEALLYYSLNKGFSATSHNKIKNYVHRNPDNSEVDFNVRKYLKPVKKAPVKKHVFAY